MLVKNHNKITKPPNLKFYTYWKDVLFTQKESKYLHSNPKITNEMIIWTRSVEMNRKVSIMARDKAGKGSIAHEAGGSKVAGEGRALNIKL